MEITNIITIAGILISLITSAIALFQTHKQIKLSNKQYLFKERTDKFIFFKSLIDIYYDSFSLLNYSNTKDNEPITVDYLFENLTNSTYLKDITSLIYNCKNDNLRVPFLIKMEELRKLSYELKYLFSGEVGIALMIFVNNYRELLIELYKYQILLTDMKDDKIPRKQKPTYEVLQKDYGELGYRKRLYEANETLRNTFLDIKKNNIIEKAEKVIKF